MEIGDNREEFLAASTTRDTAYHLLLFKFQTDLVLYSQFGWVEKNKRSNTYVLRLERDWERKNSLFPTQIHMDSSFFLKKIHMDSGGVKA